MWKIGAGNSSTDSSSSTGAAANGAAAAAAKRNQIQIKYKRNESKIKTGHLWKMTMKITKTQPILNCRHCRPHFD